MPLRRAPLPCQSLKLFLSIAALAICLGYASSALANCSDGKRNGPETDVDCGGDCPPCEIGDVCREWRDCWTGRCGGGLCEERPYSSGDPIPAGYDVETSMHDGPATARYAGAGLFALGYLGAYVAGLLQPGVTGWLLLPVAGPWIMLAEKDDPPVPGLLAVDGVIQGAGALLLIGGIATAGKQLVRQPVPQLAIAPSRLRDGYAVSLHGQF